MNIHKLIRNVLFESDTADQAHKLGLTSAGYGYWKDNSGKTVAKSMKGKLVRLEPGEETGMASKIASDKYVVPTMTIPSGDANTQDEKCFACGKKLKPGKKVVLVDTGEDQYIPVGPDCAKKIYAAGDEGYSNPKDPYHTKLYPMTVERWKYFQDKGMASTTATEKPETGTSLHKDLVAAVQALTQISYDMGHPKESVAKFIAATMRDKASEGEIKEMMRRSIRIYDRLKKANAPQEDIDALPEWYPTDEENATYRNPNFGSIKNRPVLKNTFESLIGKPRTDTTAAETLKAELMKTLNVFPKTTIVRKKFEVIRGMVMEGLYQASNHTISLSEKSYDGLEQIAHFTKDEIDHLVHGQEELPDDEGKLNDLRGVHVFIHEMCHAKDGSIPAIIYSGKVASVPPRIESHKMLTEGLNESIARQLTWSCFSDDPKSITTASKAYQRVVHQAYQSEVDALAVIKKLRPNGLVELWALQTAEEREEYVKNFIETDFYDYLSKHLGINVKEAMSDMQIDSRFALYALTHGFLASPIEIARFPVTPRRKKHMIMKHLKSMFSHRLNTNAN